MQLELRYPASAANAYEHAALAVKAARERFDRELDYSPESLGELDDLIDGLREEGLTAEEVAELLFVAGCYLGEVMKRSLRGRWVDAARSPLAPVSPWPMVIVLPDGSAWDAIGKTYKRFELGDGEYLPAFLAAAAAGTR